MFYDSWRLVTFTHIVNWEMTEQCLWEKQHVHMRDIKHFPLRDVIWEIQKYSFEGYSFERCRLRDTTNIHLRVVPLRVILRWDVPCIKKKIPFERYHLSCLSLRSTSYLLFEKRQVFLWELSEYERIIWNAIKANPQSKFSMSNIRIKFLIVGAQSRLSRYTLKANSQSKPSKYKPNNRTLTK